MVEAKHNRTKEKKAVPMMFTFSTMICYEQNKKTWMGFVKGNSLIRNKKE